MSRLFDRFSTNPQKQTAKIVRNFPYSGVKSRFLDRSSTKPQLQIAKIIRNYVRPRNGSKSVPAASRKRSARAGPSAGESSKLSEKENVSRAPEERPSEKSNSRYKASFSHLGVTQLGQREDVHNAVYSKSLQTMSDFHWTSFNLFL